MLRSHEGWLPKCIDEEDAAKHHAGGNWTDWRGVQLGTKFSEERDFGDRSSAQSSIPVARATGTSLRSWIVLPISIEALNVLGHLGPRVKMENV